MAPATHQAQRDLSSRGATAGFFPESVGFGMITLSRPGTEMTALPSSVAHAPGLAFNEFNRSSSC